MNKHGRRKAAKRHRELMALVTSKLRELFIRAMESTPTLDSYEVCLDWIPAEIKHITIKMSVDTGRQYSEVKTDGAR